MFQVVLLDSPSKAGTRLVIPCLATPLGGLLAGIVMSRWGKLALLVRTGAALMLVGNFLVVLLRFNDSQWKYCAYVIPANLGQGIVYPGILFTFLAAFDHSGKLRLLSSTIVCCRPHYPSPRPTEPSEKSVPVNHGVRRSCRLCFNRLPRPLPWERLGRGCNIDHHAEHTKLRPRGGLEWNTRQMESTLPSPLDSNEPLTKQC